MTRASLEPPTSTPPPTLGQERHIGNSLSRPLTVGLVNANY